MGNYTGACTATLQVQYGACWYTQPPSAPPNLPQHMFPLTRNSSALLHISFLWNCGLLENTHIYIYIYYTLYAIYTTLTNTEMHDALVSGPSLFPQGSVISFLKGDALPAPTRPTFSSLTYHPTWRGQHHPPFSQVGIDVSLLSTSSVLVLNENNAPCLNTYGFNMPWFNFNWFAWAGGSSLEGSFMKSGEGHISRMISIYVMLHIHVSIHHMAYTALLHMCIYIGGRGRERYNPHQLLLKPPRLAQTNVKKNTEPSCGPCRCSRSTDTMCLNCFGGSSMFHFPRGWNWMLHLSRWYVWGVCCHCLDVWSQSDISCKTHSYRIRTNSHQHPTKCILGQDQTNTISI